MNNYKICRKVNFDSESQEKQNQILNLTKIIQDTMNAKGFVEADDKSKEIKYVFSVGGDGTMLHSMHQHIHKNAIIIGINAGNVGFLTPYTIEDVITGSLFKSLSEDSVQRVEQRSILKHTLMSGDTKKTGVAVNDYAITAEGPNDMLDFSIEVEHRGHVSKAGHYRANAIVISGPCGSTAYNMNAGGAIVDPSMKCMQIVMIAPTTLGARPLIIGKNSTIRVHFHNKAKIFPDGMFYGSVPTGDKEMLSISLMKKESNVLVPDDWNFYSVLSKKLHWNNGRDVQ